ncbi:MAG TPA: ABC transporter ATP-binding protein [Coleofasciculaceae cyanobacterium]|jgi:simple sugar transport system ATP-binding protein
MTILEACSITKQFPGVLANDRLNFSVNRGEIHVLLGENGAGKTTLMNILYGLESPDSGEIRVDGESVSFSSPNDAIRQGVGMVHQHFMLVPVFTVTENIVLGVEQTKNSSRWLGRLGVLDRKSPEARIRELSQRFGLSVNPRSLVGDLPVGIQQKVEIIKALYRGAQILILDEPTAVLTPQEVTELFNVIGTLTQQGMSVIVITHKLKEVLAIADRISVMHQGRMIGSVKPTETNEAMLAQMMVGRKIILQVEKTPASPGEPVLQVRGLHVLDDRRQRAVDGVDLAVQAGEIVGIAGVQGNGQTELVEAITGLRSVSHGNIFILGQKTTHATPRQIIETGVGHIPEDREKHGLVKTYSLIDNCVLCTYYKPPFAKGMVLQEEAIAQNANQLIKEFDVRPPNPQYPAGGLSGGNKQKLIIARELSRGAKLLIASQPTRGVDVGSIEFIHKRIVAARDRGLGVLLISSELDEILALCDRVAVMFKGKIIETLPIFEATRERLGLLMAGVQDQESRRE